MARMEKKPRYQLIDGLRVPLALIPEICQSAMKFSPGKDDIIVGSFPTAGATWVSQIVLLILRDGRPCESADEFFSSAPILEMIGSERIKYAIKPGCIRTYLPFNRLNFSTKAKYIYVARHPNDCAVSLYHHVKECPTYFFTDGSFDDFLEQFYNGDVIYNDYYDHYISGHGHGHYPNAMKIKYDFIKNNRTEAILKIARFLDEKYYGRLKFSDSKLMKHILYYSSEEYMTSTVNGFWRELFLDKPSEDFQSKYPVAKKYADVLLEAENCGHCLPEEYYGEGHQEMKLTRKQIKKLKSYVWSKEEYEDSWDFHHLHGWVPENG